MTDDHAAVDALVAELHPGVAAGPGVQTRDVILVTGPWLAGSTSVAEALRHRLPDRTFVEAADLERDHAPAAVVYVTSAVAPLTESDFVLLDSAAANTDLVVGAVSKVDVHRDWRDVLENDRSAVAEHDSRYADMVWVGVAAAPERGEPQLDELVDELDRALTHNELSRRNRLRAWQTRLQNTLRRHDDAAAGAGREARVAALRQERHEALRQRRLAKSERTIALRSRIQQAKVQLSYYARKRCASVRSELEEDASTLNRRKLPEFEVYAARRVADVIGEVDASVGKDLGELATEFGLTPPESEPPPDSPPVLRPSLTTGGLEGRLMMLLGAFFGLGVALTVSRLFADLAPAYTAAGLLGGAFVGLAVAVWVVSMRRVLRDRAVLERWIADLVGELRAVVEQLVATRVLHAESALIFEQAQLDEAETAEVAEKVTAIDNELREHAVAAAQATALRDRELPALQRALEAVHAELNRSCE